MATHKSAIKRQRQNVKRREHNRQVRSKVRTFVKRLDAAAESGDAEKAAAELKEATKVVAKAASKGVIPKQTASRKISRMAKRVNKAGASA